MVLLDCLWLYQSISSGDGPCFAVALLRVNAVKKLKDMIHPTDPHDDRFWQSAFGIERIASHVYCTTFFLSLSLSVWTKCEFIVVLEAENIM